MYVCDFARSHLLVQADLDTGTPPGLAARPTWRQNTTRYTLACRARVTPTLDGDCIEYLLASAVCGARPNSTMDVWSVPAATTHLVVSDHHFLQLRHADSLGRETPAWPPERGTLHARETGPLEGHFSEVLPSIHTVQSEELSGPAAIAAVLAGRRLVAWSEFITPDESAVVWLEYPVHVVDASQRHGYVQIQTGPVLFPDTQDDLPMIDSLRLAMVAHNGASWAEFLLNEPIPLATGGALVHHYARPVHVDARNRLFALD